MALFSIQVGYRSSQRELSLSTQHLSMITLADEDVSLLDSTHKPDTEIAHCRSQQTDHSIAFTCVHEVKRGVVHVPSMTWLTHTVSRF